MHLSGDSNRQEPSDKADAIIRKTVQRKWQSYLWDTFDKSSEERKFMFKLDFALLTFASLGAPLFSHSNEVVVDGLRLFYQVPRPVEYQQCFRLGDVSVIFSVIWNNLLTESIGS